MSKETIQAAIDERDGARSKSRRQAQAEAYNNAALELNRTHAEFGCAMHSGSILESQNARAIMAVGQ
jgi:hypothetical protein